jgi:hypothetical protein
MVYFERDERRKGSAMPSETRLETRPESVEFFVREERVVRYLPGGQNPGLSTLRTSERRAVMHSHFEDSVALWIGYADLGGWEFGEDTVDAPGVTRSQGVIARRGSHSVGLQHSCDRYTPDGQLLLREVRTLRVQAGPADGTSLELQLELRAPADRTVTLKRSDRGLLRMRLASAFLSSSGTIRNSAGDYGVDVDRRSAAWCGCVGVVQAETIGLVILDHPTNPAHPPAWNLDASGVLEINPHAWQDTVIAAGASIEFRYRLLTHAGYVEQGWADRRLQEFASPLR